ncbi:MAG: type II toxin-antitoxin system HicB family antitoxin [Synergistaceae bacterium]|jgi:predicted RNase H-like HicB family nuclease|nr:type II toxin-antitoxin system HicB family antitoxin [Synergistaceae bacterium]
MRKQDHYVFPAVFFQNNNYIGVRFPDLPGCNTFGENPNDAIRMARDALGGHLLCMEDAMRNIPQPTPFSEIELESGESLVLVEVWLSILRDGERNKAIKKSVTIPNWLNKKAVEAQVNFSNTLQEALLQKLGL